MEIQEAKKIIECLLFVSDKPLSLTTLKTLLDDMDRREIIQCLDELQAEYDLHARAFHLVEIAEGYQLVTRVALAPWIRKLYKNRASNKLSRAALETMAIIAYRQPISKAEVEDIRGVSADGVMNSLLERKLIRVVGRKEVIGRPLLYGTTKEFLHYFGLKDLSDMPEMQDLQDMLRQDEVGEDWELNSEGTLVAKIKAKEETETLPAHEPGTESLHQTPDLPESQTVETTEGTMQNYTENQTTQTNGMSDLSLAIPILDGQAAVATGYQNDVEIETEILVSAELAKVAAKKEKKRYDDEDDDLEDDEDELDDEDDDLEDDEDELDDEDDDLEDDEDELDDEDDGLEDDEDELDDEDDDLEDDEDELDDEDNDLEDDEDELDDEDDDLEDDEDELDDEDDDLDEKALDDIEDLGTEETEKPIKGRDKKNKYLN